MKKLFLKKTLFIFVEIYILESLFWPNEICSREIFEDSDVVFLLE